MLKRLIRVFFFLSFEYSCFISLIKVYKIMSRTKSGSRYCLFCYRTTLQEPFYFHFSSLGDKYLSNLTVLNDDGIIDFESGIFPRVCNSFV